MKRSASIVLCSLVLACGGGKGGKNGGGGGSGGGGGTVDSAQAVSTLEKAQCLAFGCIFGVAPSLQSTWMAECQADPQIFTANLKKELDAGRMKVDPAKEGACATVVSAFNLASCWGEHADLATVGGELDKCKGMLSGAVKSGGTCYSSDECDSGFCGYPQDSCPGQCEPPAGVGESCSGPTRCQDGLNCTFDSNFHEVCQTPVAKGGACGSTSDCKDGLYCNTDKCDDTKSTVGGDCSIDDLQCPDGTNCRHDTTNGTSTCATQAHAGGACDAPGFFGIVSSDCLGMQVCVGGTGDGSNAGKCATPSDAGAACDPDAPKATGCYLGLACDPATKKCVDAPSTEGAACVQQQCGGNLYCNQANKCVPLPTTAGAACVQQQCGGDLACDSADDTCKQLPTTDGEACVNSQCGKNFTCDDGGHCRALPATGQSCASSFECVDGDYCDTTETCAAKLADGATCDPNDVDECVGGCDEKTNKCAPTSETCLAP